MGSVGVSCNLEDSRSDHRRREFRRDYRSLDCKSLTTRDSHDPSLKSACPKMETIVYISNPYSMYERIYKKYMKKGGFSMTRNKNLVP